jgi:hypothetical protein
MINHKFDNKKLEKIANLCQYAIDACIRSDLLHEEKPHYMKRRVYARSVWRLVFEAYKEAVFVK